MRGTGAAPSRSRNVGLLATPTVLPTAVAAAVAGPCGVGRGSGEVVVVGLPGGSLLPSPLLRPRPQGNALQVPDPTLVLSQVRSACL